MPYIKEDRRDALLYDDVPQNPGELNYAFTTIAEHYWATHGNYQGINDILGALEGAKLEFYRRIAVPYENEKMKLNGDVYEQQD